MPNFYLHRDGQNHGPYSREEMKAFLADGQILPEEMVCEEGGDWVPAATLAKPAAPRLVVPPTGRQAVRSNPRPQAAATRSNPGVSPHGVSQEMIEAADGKARFALKGIVISIAVPVILFAAQLDKQNGVKVSGRRSGLQMLSREMSDFLPLAIVLGIVGVVVFSNWFVKARRVSKELKAALGPQKMG